MCRKFAAVLCFLGLALALVCFSGDATAQKGEKGKKKLPTYWSKLKLSTDQKADVQKIYDDYGPKIDKLNEQLTALKKDQTKELFKVLTEPQKDQLRKIYADKVAEDLLLPPKTQNKEKDKENKQ
jgi:hypothetical protein